jgi:Major capsid protein Gp23
MYLTENLESKWSPVLDHDGLNPIKDTYRRAVTAVLLENQEKAMAEEARTLNEAAPTNSGGGLGAGTGVGSYDPILISLVRRALPNLIAYDVCGVQPMTGPTGLIFAMRARYKAMNVNSTSPATANEALFFEANSAFSSQNSAGGFSDAIVGNPANTDPVFSLGDSSVYGTGKGMSTAEAEALGDGTSGNDFAEMAFNIDKVTVTARSRALKAEYTTELAQDLKAIHGLDAETELANILSTEILAEINREVIRTIYRSASVGCQYGVTTAGTFDLDTDSNGRWSVEKFKGLIFQIEREANAIAKATRRGKGNVIIVSSDVASAMAMAGVLSYTPALQADLTVDDTGNTFVGTLHGRIKVYIDPYFGGSSVGDELVTVGYRGQSPFDAGLFYCPYVPLQMVRAIGQETFQPKIGFKTRYGMVANPFATTNGDGVVGDRNTSGQANIYYRIFRVRNLT